MKSLLFGLTSLLLLQPVRGALAQAPAAPESLIPGITIRAVATAGEGAVRIARHPLTNDLYFMRMDGRIFRISPPFDQDVLLLIQSAADHGMASPRGMAFGPDGALYLVGNHTEGDNNVATIIKGVESGDTLPTVWTWTTVARTAPYPLSNRNVDHLYSAITVSPDGHHLFINAGSRTDHGEVQSNDGKFPGVREVPLTSAIIRIRTDARDLVLPNDEAALKSGGYLYADGTRNTFDLAFSPEGELFGTENSGDRDDNEELNWIREGHHYGFPWRMGTNNTPQQYPGYDPAKDTLVNKNSYGYTNGFFHDDPSYPAPPSGVSFTEPLGNTGPDAINYRDSATGDLDTPPQGRPLATFTSHRSPLGLVFDPGNTFPGEFRGSGFVMSWTEGTTASNDLLTRMYDPGQDMLQITIAKIEDRYEITSRRVVRGFAQPIDAEIIGTKVYVLEFGGEHKIWEVDFSAVGSAPLRTSAGATLSKPYPNPSSGVSQLALSVPRTGHIRAEVRDMLGNRIATLHDGIVAAGETRWMTFDASSLPNGMYIITAQGENIHLSEEVMVVR